MIAISWRALCFGSLSWGCLQMFWILLFSWTNELWSQEHFSPLPGRFCCISTLHLYNDVKTLLKRKQPKDSAGGLSCAGFASVHFGFLLFREHCPLWASEVE